MTSWNEIGRQVERRARQRCEYCKMHQSLQGATFHIEHILPRSLGGTSVLDNLTWTCPSCNLHKSDRVVVQVAGETDAIRLFHPRRDRWIDHFQWEGYRAVARTLVGQTTIDLLQFNHERKLLIRRAEALFDLFPPTIEGC